MIFIDTGPFLARYLERDQYHKQATESWNYLKLTKEHCCTSNFVLNELFTLLARRAGNIFTYQRAKNIYSSKNLKILRPSEEDEQKAIDLLEKYYDQMLSFTDCISFVLINKNKVKRVFSFDKHFQLISSNLLP